MQNQLKLVLSFYYERIMNFVHTLNNQSNKPDESCSMPTLSQRLECVVSQTPPGKVSKYSITLIVKARI